MPRGTAVSWVWGQALAFQCVGIREQHATRVGGQANLMPTLAQEVWKFSYMLSTVLRMDLTCDLDLVTRLAVTKEVTTDALLGRILLPCLWIPVDCSSDTETCCPPIKIITISCWSNGVEADTVWHSRLLRILTLQQWRGEFVMISFNTEKQACQDELIQLLFRPQKHYKRAVACMGSIYNCLSGKNNNLDRTYSHF